MKQLIIFSFLPTFLIAACNNNKSGSSTTTEETTKGTADSSLIVASDVVAQKLEELKKLTPLTTDQLQALVPDEFRGIKRSSLNDNSGSGVASVIATYNDSAKQLRVSIWDCAGEAGVGIYNIRYYTRWNFEQSDDNGYQKTIDFNGGKAIEKYSKDNDQYDLTYMANDRMLVTMEGQKMGLDSLKEAAKNFTLK